MPGRARASSWSGPVLAVLSLAALPGCAFLPASEPAGIGDDRAPVEFWTRAVAADAAGRESLWQSLRGEAHGTDIDLRRGLLLSLPNHSGYDPAAAEGRLRAALAQPSSPMAAALARMRLTELRDGGQCQAEVRDLRERLAKVVDIERQFNRNGR